MGIEWLIAAATVEQHITNNNNKSQNQTGTEALNFNTDAFSPFIAAGGAGGPPTSDSSITSNPLNSYIQYSSIFPGSNESKIDPNNTNSTLNNWFLSALTKYSLSNPNDAIKTESSTACSNESNSY